MTEFARIFVYMVASLVLAGGIFAGVKAKSAVSLVASVLSAGLLAAGAAMSVSDPKGGLLVCDGVGFVLFIIGTVRFRKTKKFMPGGVIQMLGAFTLIVVTYALIKM